MMQPIVQSPLALVSCRALQRSPTYPATLKEHAGYSEASIRNCIQVCIVSACYVLVRQPKPPADFSRMRSYACSLRRHVGSLRYVLLSNSESVSVRLGVSGSNADCQCWSGTRQAIASVD